MLRALIVDDDPVNTRFLSEILAPHATCDVAENGRRGLEAFGRALTDGTPYDIIFLDVMMPGMDGHQALERMRHLEQGQGVPRPRRPRSSWSRPWTIPAPCTGPFSRAMPCRFWASPFPAKPSCPNCENSISSPKLSEEDS